MFTRYCMWFVFVACSILVTNAGILNDLQEAQKFVDQLDYDYSAVTADALQQRPDLLWYDYGGGGGGGGGSYYGSAGPGAATAAMLFGGEKRGGATQTSTSGIWFGPRLGRRKRHGGGGGTVQQSFAADGSGAAGQAGAQDAMAAGQAAVSELINNAPWLLLPIIENSLMQLKQNTRPGRSSLEDGDDEPFSTSRHTAVRSPPYSPPYSPPFSPRLGRQASMARPQVPRLGREASVYKRAVAAALQFPRRQQLQERQQQAGAPAATESASAAEARRHPV